MFPTSSRPDEKSVLLPVGDRETIFGLLFIFGLFKKRGKLIKKHFHNFFYCSIIVVHLQHKHYLYEKRRNKTQKF